MAQLSAAIDGIAEACTALGTPITGGNVSLYNETKGDGIYPTPVIGVVGLLEDVSKAVPSGFQREGQTVALLSAPTKPHAGIETDADAQRVIDTFASNTMRRMGSSEFAKTVLDSVWGTPPHLHIEGNASLHRFLIDLADRGLLTAGKDISDGGVAVALAQMTFDHGVGATVNKGGLGPISGLFEEDASEIVVTFETDKLEQIRGLAEPFGVWVNRIGVTGGDRLSISINSELAIDQPIESLLASFTSTLESQLAAEVVTA
jgi:phosphoribosylformylglycinamidine synthase